MRDLCLALANTSWPIRVQRGLGDRVRVSTLYPSYGAKMGASDSVFTDVLGWTLALFVGLKVFKIERECLTQLDLLISAEEPTA